MMKGKRSSDKISGVTGDSIKSMDVSEFQSLLDELNECRHSGNIASKSKLTQELMKQAEESESGEESIKRFTRQRVKKPREQRRRRKDSLCVSVSNTTGGSLDNISDCRARDRGAAPAGGRSGKRGPAGGQSSAAGSSREGGSCCNLSRGSFEPVSRRRRRRKTPASGSLAHHGSLEDLSETAGLTGQLAGGGGLDLGVKHGGSLQNISQPSPVAPARRNHVVIDIYDEPPAPSPPRVTSSSSPECQAPAATCSAVDADAAVNFPLTLTKRCSFDSTDVNSVDGKRVGMLSTRLKLSRSCDEPSYGSNKDCSLLAKPIISSESSLSALSVANGRLALHSSRPFSLSTARGDSDRHVIRLRKAKKKGVCVLTDSVDGYRGHDHVDSLLDFIEPGCRSAGKEKSSRRGGGSALGGGGGRKESAVSRTTRRAPARGDEERRGADRKLRGRRPAAARSCSLEPPSHVDSGAAAAELASSRYCGDLATSRGSVPSPDDDADFQLVTRRQRRPRQPAPLSSPAPWATEAPIQSLPATVGSSWAQIARVPVSLSTSTNGRERERTESVSVHTRASSVHSDAPSSVSSGCDQSSLLSQHAGEAACAMPVLPPVAADCTVVSGLPPLQASSPEELSGISRSSPVVLRNSAGMHLNGDCHMKDMFFSREVSLPPGRAGTPSPPEQSVFEYKHLFNSDSVSALNDRLSESRTVTFGRTTAGFVGRRLKQVEPALNERLHFGYVSGEEAADRSSADASNNTALSAAASTFSSRFRPPAVNVAHFNWREISVVLNSVYEEAVRSAGRIPSSNPAT